MARAHTFNGGIKSGLKLLRTAALAGALLVSAETHAQTDIFRLMERTDLRMDEVEAKAAQIFSVTGTGQGSGFKQYQRWLYERKFHLDANGYFIPAENEDRAYHDALRGMGIRLRSAKQWSELGPNYWSRTSGWNPGVGRLTSLAVHPSDTTTIYVTSPGGGIWKSTNSGNSWTPLIDFVNSSWMNLFHIVIDPNNTSTLYASLSSGGVLKSTNGGTSWAATGTGPSSSRQVKVHPGNSSIVFAAATNGLWRSTDGGSTWTRVETAHKEDIEFMPGNPDIMYASGSSGTSCVWRSTNNGVSWTAITSTSGITNSGRTLIAVSAANPALVYAVQANGSEFGRLYRSTDTGKTFTTRVTGSPASGTNYFGYETTGTGTGGQATYDMAICVNPLNANEVHIAGIICWVSTNGGTSFTAETAWSLPNSVGYNHADVHALEWVKGTIYSGSDGGIYKSINRGGDWTDLSAGLGIRQFYRISCAKTDANVIVTGAQDNGSSFRRSTGAWVDWLGADGMDNVISPTNAAVSIGTSQYGSIYKTTNSGGSYSNLTRPNTGNWVTPLVGHPTSADTIWGGWTGVFRSSNGGTSWTNIASGVISVTVDVLEVSKANTRYIWATKGSTIYRTTNGGSSWSTLTAPSTVTSIYASKYDANRIWITCNSSTNRVYRSNDGGSTWINLSTGLPSVSARSVVVDEDAHQTVYVGMNIGVYYRDTLTNTWTEHGSGLPLVAINEVEIQKSGNKLRVATYGRGVWESDLQNITFTCNAPSGLSASSITSSSASLSWSAVTGAASYKVDYKLSSDTTWTVIQSATTSTSVSLSGLSAAVAYDWRVRTNCSSGSSSFTASSFNTLSSCGTPGSLAAGTTTAGVATLSWSAVSGASSYSVDYKTKASGTWNSTAGSGTNSFTISGLSAGSYDWRVRANCSSGSSSWVSSDFVVWCASAGTSTTAGFVDYVALGSIARTSTSDGGYFNGAGLSTNIKPGSSYTITLSPGYSGAKKNVYFRVYIDYNRDGDFADAGEQVGQKTFKNVTNTTITFTVPTGASLGASRLRVVMSTNAYQSPCVSYSNGETEDYTVNITTTPMQQPDPDQEVREVQLLVFPNPASDRINLRYTLTQENAAADFRILDMQGRAVAGSRFSAAAGENLSSIDISTLPAGMYILQMHTAEGKKETRFMIAR